MKEKLFLPISIVLSAGLLCAALLSLSQSVRERAHLAPSAGLTIQAEEARPYMSLREAAEYLGIPEERVFSDLLAGGALDGTFLRYQSESHIYVKDVPRTVRETEYIFSRERLDAWMLFRIDSGQPLN